MASLPQKPLELEGDVGVKLGCAASSPVGGSECGYSNQGMSQLIWPAIPITCL